MTPTQEQIAETLAEYRAGLPSAVLDSFGNFTEYATRLRLRCEAAEARVRELERQIADDLLLKEVKAACGRLTRERDEALAEVVGLRDKCKDLRTTAQRLRDARAVVMAERDKIRAALRDAKAAGMCDACAGEGSIGGATCMCGGSGLASDAVHYLRKTLFDERAALAQHTAELAALRHLRLFSRTSHRNWCAALREWAKDRPSCDCGLDAALAATAPTKGS